MWARLPSGRVVTSLRSVKLLKRKYINLGAIFQIEITFPVVRDILPS